MIIRGLLFITIACQSFTLFASAYPWPESTWEHLDVGIYWVGKGNVYCKAGATTSKESAACKAAYSPNKPTMIFLHGWMPASVRMHMRFDYHNPGWGLPEKYTDLGKIWRDKGWNIGVFYWNQISDTATPQQAEAKIWSTKTSQAMYWKQYDPNAYWTYNKVVDKNACASDASEQEKQYCKPVGQLAYEAYVSALANYKGSQIRIVGHSLGAQLGVYLTHDIAEHVKARDIPPKYLPQQLVLLDTAVTPYNPLLSNVGIDNTEKVSQYVSALIQQDGILVTEFLSSDITMQDKWDSTASNVALVYYRPWFLYSFDEVSKHSAAWFLYLESMKDAPPPMYRLSHTGEAMPTGELGISAETPEFVMPHNNAPSEGIATLVGSGYYLDQDCRHNGKLCGQYSPNTTDEGFLEVSKNMASSPDVSKLEINYQNHIISNGGHLSLHPGQLIHLHYSVEPADAANKLILWRTENKSIVRVFPGGYLKAIRPGKVKILAIAPNNMAVKPIVHSFTVTIN